MRGFTIFFCFLQLAIQAQRISAFNVYNVKGVVAVRFSILPGPTCSGYTIYRSTDSTTYWPIETYGGVCGTSSSAEDHSYDDHSPAVNQVNYYKIQLQPYEVSPIRGVYVSASPLSSLLLFPDPVLGTDDILNMRFYNVTNAHMVGYLYDRTGHTMRTFDLVTENDHYAFSTAGLRNGLYVVWLTDGKQAYVSKFVVYR